ncbi:hypothetical protein [Psychrilyobacter atlanticus]|uniref:hypothetical protein n=1 Tax=Psychrilyobacter atlanticus TaxID=271091 RepID=UPI00040B7617|nr:hypothetical protein [Psychrilyobacter atlanticus]
MNQAVALANNIKIGTVTIVFNTIFLLAYIILTKGKYKVKYLIQGVSTFMFGFFINYFTYNVLSGVLYLNYFQRILLLSLGTIISGASIGMIAYYNVITFPLEGICIEVNRVTKVPFIKLRYLIDIISIAISLGISFSTNIPILVREGTIISMILLSLSIGLTKNHMEEKRKKMSSNLA